MPKREKLLAKLRSLPTDMRFGDVEKILLDLGWTVRDPGGTHVVVQSPDGRSITIVRDGQRKVKRGYLRRLVEEIERGEGT